MIRVRRAEFADLPYLEARLSESDLEQVELGKSIVLVAEEDGYPIGLVAAQLSWRVEPLYLFPEFEKHAPRMALRRAALLLGEAIDAYLCGPRNPTQVRGYYAIVRKTRELFGSLMEHFGLVKFEGQLYARQAPKERIETLSGDRAQRDDPIPQRPEFTGWKQ